MEQRTQYCFFSDTNMEDTDLYRFNKDNSEEDKFDLGGCGCALED